MLRKLAAAALAATVAATLISSPASAAAVSTVTKTSGISTASKHLTVGCPAGRIAVGAQASISGNPYGVHLTGIWPAGRTVRVYAEVLPELSPKPSWSLTVRAHCVPRPAGLVEVSSPPVTAPNDDDGRRFGRVTDAACPDGKELIGMGGQALGGVLDALQPLGRGVPYTNDFVPLMHGVRVLGSSRAQNPGGATLRAKAVCADPGHGSTFGTAELGDALPVKSVTATCPAGTTFRSIGFVTFYPNHYDTLTPFSYAFPTTVSAPAENALRLRVQRHRDPLPAEEWRVAVQPLCAA